MKKLILILVLAISANLIAEEEENSFKKPESPFRNVPINEVAHNFFYSTKGVVTMEGNGIPNYNMGFGFRHQKGIGGFDLNLNVDNCLVIVNAQASAQGSILQYIKPKMDETQYYIGEGVSFTYGRQILERETRRAVGFNLMWGREAPLNWQERKFFQINIDLPVAKKIAHEDWILFDWELPSIQIKFGRSF
ncbi:MAG: hypothetical protein P0S95_05865 [Rhabdochlamydiaceae bacterium]|nr:hypothetical protein [Candidatus Amphrikana amoebophyrae]